MEEILTIKYKSESLEIEFKGSLEDGIKLLTKLEPPRLLYQTLPEKQESWKLFGGK